MSLRNPSTDRAAKKLLAVKASRTGLLKAPMRDWQTPSTYTDLFVVPTRKKHGSGWMCMALVGLKSNGTPEMAAWCDDVCWNNQTTRRDHSMRCDCSYPGGILHFWGATFTVGHSLSSTDVTVTDQERVKVAA